MMIELEKQRMEVAKELELQRMNMLMEMQLELEKSKLGKRRAASGKKPALQYLSFVHISIQLPILMTRALGTGLIGNQTPSDLRLTCNPPTSS